MTVGIPGTGIGGMFYLLLAFIMPVKEACLLCKGRSSLKRWAHVATQLFNASGIIASVWLMGWLLALLIEKCVAAGWISPTGMMARQTPAVVSLASACMALVTLGCIVVVANLLKFVVPRRPAADGGDTPAL